MEYIMEECLKRQPLNDCISTILPIYMSTPKDLSVDEWETMAAAFEAEDVMRIQDLFDEYKAKMPVFLVMRAMEECQKFYAATSEPSE